MADKYAKVTPKVHPFTYIGIIGFIIVIVGLILIFQPSEQEKIYAAYASQQNIDNTYFKEDHPFDQVKYSSTLFNKGLKDIIDDEEYVLLYIGRPTCEACVNNIGAFAHFYFEFELDTYFDSIYYLNSEEDTKGLTEIDEDYAQINQDTPQLIAFKDGEILRVITFRQETDRTNINQNVFLFYQALKAQLEAE
ncbi:MAG: hypothetical protein EP317_03700 [Bacillota bacterium]|nr:MAG: hypothetical protein EP317_03700 [Bacillota bacterium]